MPRKRDDPALKLLREAAVHRQFRPFSELDAMIAQGWGDVPQDKIPDDWRTRRRQRYHTSLNQDLERKENENQKEEDR